MSRYLLGIDLGTTNSAVAYIDLSSARPGRGAAPAIEIFQIPQLVAAGELKPRPLLPSFLYLPGPHDLPAGAAALPWAPDCSYVVGEFARNQGARVPGRLATSAKSWLCHAGVDRTAPLLPWSAPPDVPRLSPVDVSARYLRHMVQAWNHAMAQDDPERRLEKQAVVLTVPASFDDVARALTVDAARQAGIENLTLLEEPQAAFYCWLATHSHQEAGRIKPGHRCLVIDVGGGTSDFSLIQAVEQQGELGFVRQAVGDHLLLGGDNMDLALAKFVETRLPAAGRLDAVQYAMLTQACRQAKETLLSPNPPADYTVTVMGRGRQVIGGALHAALKPAEVKQVIIDGFLPVVGRDEEPKRGARAGLHEMGLPYVNDPAIMRHLAAFLNAHRPDEGMTGRPDDRGPAAILFNGGVFQPQILRARVVEVMHKWFDAPGQTWQPLALTNPSLDLAVAWGAAHYAWLRHSGGRRIGGGIARSYYIAVASDEAADEGMKGRQDEGMRKPPTDSSPIPSSPDLLIPSSLQPLTLVCVVPQHLEEGQEIALKQPELELALGQPVLFPMYTSTVRGDDQAGNLLRAAPDQLLQLPPLHTILRGGKRSGTKRVPVTLAARCTEIGTLELWCVATEGANRWRLEFNIRDIVKEPPPPGEQDDTPADQALTDVWPEAQVQEAARLIRATYSSNPSGTEAADKMTRRQDEGISRPATDSMIPASSHPFTPSSPRDLTKALEVALDASRHQWPTGLCRRLWDFLAEVADRRRQSPAHFSRWYNLVGFSLRPGFGDPLDRFRVEQLWKLLHAPTRTPASGGRKSPDAAARSAEGGADYWIMWRRVAGGLSAQYQATLYNRLRPVLLPAKGKAVYKPGANELAEMWRAAASLERLDVKQKELLAQALLKSLRRSPAPTHGFFALTRLGARVLLYGPLNAVVHHQLAETWLDAVLPFAPGNESENRAWLFCLTQLARKSGQRALDIDDSRRQRVLETLRARSAPAHWIRMVEEFIELEGDEQTQMFGESLPIGLRLLREE